jgi:predicted metal-dependent enzyme (double-stranded beta helix superfamily)
MTGRSPAVFDIDQLISDCQAAVHETEPRRAAKEVLERVVRRRDLVAALPTDRAAIVPLYAGEDVTVLHVVWAPGMRIWPHNHLMWAAIALYSGQEDNTFFRRDGDRLAQAGGRELRDGDVALLGDDTIHAVHNPRRSFTGAVHVYGGDLTTRTGRSEWDDETGVEVPYDFERTRAYFDAANADT